MLIISAFITIGHEYKNVEVEGHCYRTVFGNLTAKVESVRFEGENITHRLTLPDRMRLEKKLISHYLYTTHPKGDTAHSGE